MWLEHTEQRSPIGPFSLLLIRCTIVARIDFFVDSNEFKIKLYSCDRVATMKSSIPVNRHSKLFAGAVVTLRYYSSSADFSVKLYQPETNPKMFVRGQNFNAGI